MAEQHNKSAPAAMQELLIRLLAFTGDGVYRYSLEEGKLLEANQGLVDILQLDCKPEQLVGKRLKDILIYTEREGTVRKALAERGEIHGYHYHFKTLRGEDRWVIHDSFIMEDPKSGAKVVEAIVKDITAAKRAEQDLLRSQKLESLGLLAGGIAHDFNNILTAILGNVSLAQACLVEHGREGPSGEVRGLLAEVEKASLRARELSEQLLTFAKGGLPIKRLADLRGLIRESAEFALRGSRSKCEFEIDADLWSAEIDSGQIAQVVQNLVLNADQAQPEGGIVAVRAENCPTSRAAPAPLSPGSYVRISVRDYGAGIRKEDRQKIFDPYYTTKAHGVGLGLTTAYSIVRKHGGLMQVESEEGQGSTFSVLLPSTQSPAPETEMPDGAAALASAGRVLVMDDQELILTLARRVLARAGYNTETARDGAEAVRHYSEALDAGQRFDVVILDLTVPGGMGGKETLEKLREKDPAVKAIASSGYSNAPIMADFKAHGFRGILAKPYRMKQLLETVAAVIEDGG
jgi:PAS domain S-box-containing protein